MYLRLKKIQIQGMVIWLGGQTPDVNWSGLTLSSEDLFVFIIQNISAKNYHTALKSGLLFICVHFLVPIFRKSFLTWWFDSWLAFSCVREIWFCNLFMCYSLLKVWLWGDLFLLSSSFFLSLEPRRYCPSL